MASIPLPETGGRLSQTLDLFASSGGNTDLTSAFDSFLSTNDLQSSGAIDPLAFLNSMAALMGTQKRLGSIEKLEVSQTREIDRIYGLGSYAFEPYRVVPKAIKTSLTLTKVVLYTEDFLKSVGFNSYNIFYQQAPFIIRQVLIDPNNLDKDPDVIFYFDCWISSNPYTFDLSSDGNNLVKQEIKVECGRILVSSANHLAKFGVAKFIKKNISFLKS